MIKIVREVTADVIKRGSTRAVYAKQHDRNSRFLNIRIQEEGKDIAIDSTATVMLNVERPDRQENIFYGTVNEDGTVKVPLASWMLELEGTLLCDVSIVSEDEEVAKLTTMQFNIYVEAAVVADESFIETEEYSVIVDLLNRTTEAEAKAAAAAQNAEALRAECEKATAEAKAVKEGVEAGGYIESLKELNKGEKFSTWVGTTAEYIKEVEDGAVVSNCLYLITDEASGGGEWIEILSSDPDDVSPHMGFYRLVNGMYFVHLEFVDSSFDRTTGRMTIYHGLNFDLPHDNYFLTTPISIVGGDSIAEQDCYYTGYAEIYKDRIELFGLTPPEDHIGYIATTLTFWVPQAQPNAEV